MKINTKQDLKLAVKSYAVGKKEPFKTKDIANDFQELTGKVRISPNKLSNFLRGSGVVEYDPKIKKWVRKAKLL